MFGWMCEHERVRCVHGDEIVHRNYRRSVCLDCGASLPNLPEWCSEVPGRHSNA